MKILITYFGLGRIGFSAVDWIYQRYREQHTAVVHPIESLERHGFYGWLFRSMIPGLKTKVKPIGITDYDLTFVVLPKWAYNCPVINGFLDAEILWGRMFVVMVTSSKGDATGYLRRLTANIARKGGMVAAELAVSRSELAGEHSSDILENFRGVVEAKVPSLRGGLHGDG